MRPLPKIRALARARAAKPTQQIAIREQIELHPSQRDFSSPISHNYILIVHSGPVARTIPIKNHGQDSSTSQLESIRFKYLRLKQHLKELRTCPECKNRYAKHTCIKALSHGAIFLATCNAILLLVDVKLANTRFHHSLLIYS